MVETIVVTNIPEVSIIIPAYNEADRMAVCLEAPLQAKHEFGWEVIVVDDAGSDGGDEIAEALGARVLRLPRNRGVAAARNAGAKEASGEYLLFIDADVVSSLSIMTLLVEKLRQEPGLSAVGACPGPNLSTTWTSNLLLMQGDWYTRYFVSQDTNVSCFPSECGMVRRDIFWGMGGFPESHGGVGMEEFAFGHTLEREGWNNVLLPEARYSTYYDTVPYRCLELIHRTARWAPLFLRRRRLEPVVGSKTPMGEVFSCVTIALACAAIGLSLFFPSLWWVVALLLLSHLILQLPFIRFVRHNKCGGNRLALFAWPALAAMHLATLVGFALGLAKTVWNQPGIKDRP